MAPLVGERAMPSPLKKSVRTHASCAPPDR